MADFDLLRFMDRAEFMEDANCRGVNSEVFFPTRGEDVGFAKSICRACDVQAECLAYALNSGEHYGIWGGMSERERRRIRRQRPGAPAHGPIPPPANWCGMNTAHRPATDSIATAAQNRALPASKPTRWTSTSSDRRGA